MESPVLGNPDIFPSEEVIFGHLGRAKAAFALLFEENRARHPDFVENWKFYNDGKSWLLNVSRKKKTLFWLSVKKGYFQTTFYLGATAEEAVLGASIPEGTKEGFRESAGKKFRAATIVIRTKKDIEAYKALLAIKLDPHS